MPSITSPERGGITTATQASSACATPQTKSDAGDALCAIATPQWMPPRNETTSAAYAASASVAYSCASALTIHTSAAPTTNGTRPAWPRRSAVSDGGDSIVGGGTCVPGSAALGGGLQALLDLRRRNRAGCARAVLEHHPGRALHPVLLAERDVALEHAGVASGCGLGRRLAVDHPRAPRLGGVLRAPDVLRLDVRIRPQDGAEEGVDRDVLERHQVALDALAVAAVRVGEDHQPARPAALLDQHRDR